MRGVARYWVNNDEANKLSVSSRPMIGMLCMDKTKRTEDVQFSAEKRIYIDNTEFACVRFY